MKNDIANNIERDGFEAHPRQGGQIWQPESQRSKEGGLISLPSFLYIDSQPKFDENFSL